MPEGIVPWVRGAEPAAFYGQGFGAGADVASRRSALIQQAMHQQMQMAQQAAALQAEQERSRQEMQLKQEIQKQNFLQDQQRNLIMQQYHEQQVALGRQKLQEVQMMNQQKIMNAIQLQQQREQFGKAAAEAAPPQLAGMIQSGIRAGEKSAGLASLVKQMPGAQLPSNVITQAVDPQGNRIPGLGLTSKGTKIQYSPIEAQLDKAFKEDRQVQGLYRNIEEIDKLMLTADEEVAKKLQEKKTEAQRSLNTLYRAHAEHLGIGPSRSGGGEAGPASAPKSSEPSGVIGEYRRGEGLILSKEPLKSGPVKQSEAESWSKEYKAAPPPPLTEEDAQDPDKVDEWLEEYKKKFPKKDWEPPLSNLGSIAMPS